MDNSNQSSSSSFHKSRTKKRKLNSVRIFTETDEMCSTRSISDDSKRHNHSEIEKRRRDKMNTHLNIISELVQGNIMPKKLDKLTVLRMAVQQLKTLRGDDWTLCRKTGQYKPSFIQDHELKNLILQSAEGFLFVVTCDRGRLLYVSESVLQVLNFSQRDLVGQSWFDILHHNDVASVKEQLFSSGLTKDRVNDAKSTPRVPQLSNCLCPGARRSFFCKMKCKLGQQMKEEVSVGTCHLKKKSPHNSGDKKFRVMYCTGYLKWCKVSLDEAEGKEEPENWSCSLIGIAKVLPSIPKSPTMKEKTFISRYTIDCKFIFIDQRVTLVLGFLPQELLGTSIYEYIHTDDRATLTHLHKSALTSNNETALSQVFRFRNRDASFVNLRATWKSFRNPWTKEIEYLVAKNTLVFDDLSDIYSSVTDCFGPSEVEFFTRDAVIDGNRGSVRPSTSEEHHHPTSSPVKVNKMKKFADTEITDSSLTVVDSPSSSSQRNEEIVQTEGSSSPDSAQFSTFSDCVQTHGTSDENSSGSIIDHGEDDDKVEIPSQSPTRTDHRIESSKSRATTMRGSPRNPDQVEDFVGNERPCLSSNSTSGGTDEAEMAVIMSLLQTDGGNWTSRQLRSSRQSPTTNASIGLI